MLHMSRHVIGLTAYLGLTELSSTLISGVLDQFHDTTFIGSITRDLTDNATDKGGTLGSDLLKQVSLVHVLIRVCVRWGDFFQSMRWEVLGQCMYMCVDKELILVNSQLT